MPDRQDTRPPPEADARRDAAATALLSAPRAPAPPFSAAAEVSLAHMVVDYFGSEEIDPILNCDIALRDRARAILAGAAPTSASATPAAHPDAAIIVLADAASLEELTAGIRCNAAEDPPKGEDGPSFFDRSYALLEQVTATRPITFAGIAAKARVMLTHAGRGAASDSAHDLGSDHAVCELALSIARDAVRLDGGAGPGDGAPAHPDLRDAEIHFLAQGLIDAFVSLDGAERAGNGAEISEEELARLQAPAFALMKRLEDAEARTWPGMALKCLVLAVSEWWQVGYNADPADDDRNQRIARSFRDHAFAGDLPPLLATRPPALDAASSDLAHACVEQVERLEVFDSPDGPDLDDAGLDAELDRWGAVSGRAIGEPAMNASDLAAKARLALADLDRFHPLATHNSKDWLLFRAVMRDAIALGEAALASDPVEADTALRRAIAAHDAAHRAFVAATPAADEVCVAEAGGDASEDAMAPAVAARDAANDVALEAWRDLFRHRVGSLDGLLPLLRHIQQHHAGHAGIADEPDVLGYLVDNVYDLLRTGADHTPLALSALSMQQLANLMDAFATGSHYWLGIESAPWARSENSQAVVDITDVEYDRQARLQTQVADEIRRRTPTGEWDPDTRLEALIRYEMRCNGDLRSAPELRAAIAQHWGDDA